MIDHVAPSPTDLQVWALACDAALRQGDRERVQVAPLRTHATSQGIAAADFDAALTVLRTKGYLRAPAGRPALSDFAIPGYVFGQFLRRRFPRYEAIAQAVTEEIVTKHNVENTQIAQAITQPLGLVNQILEEYLAKQWLSLSRPVGRGWTVGNVQPELQRRAHPVL
jgi:hypothetical protein